MDRITYTDGIQDIVLKVKYAYHYKAKGFIPMGKTYIFDNRQAFIDKLIEMGFTVKEEETV